MNTLCDMLQPCQNDGTCNNTNITTNGYICFCQSGFQGTQCQDDYRPCQPNTCWNNGKKSHNLHPSPDNSSSIGYCNETSNMTFVCSCTLDWDGIHCEKKVDYCQHIHCLNFGVCRSLLQNYTCECLSESYSGRHCEITAQKITIRQVISKSFAYISIIAIGTVAMFVIIMDLLKYCLGIDPVKRKLKHIPVRKRPKQVVIVRFIYIDAPTSSIPVD